MPRKNHDGLQERAGRQTTKDDRPDQYETALWFLSRGDECLNCKGALHGLTMEDQPLLIKIHKAGIAAD